jgi:hypothetical protein
VDPLRLLLLLLLLVAYPPDHQLLHEWALSTTLLLQVLLHLSHMLHPVSHNM